MVSKVINNNCKKLYLSHSKCQNFRKAFEKRNFNYNNIMKIIKDSKEMWTLDKYINAPLCNEKSIYGYYRQISCEKKLESITKPCLFIDNAEDPICLKEIIPVDDIYCNPNLISITTERGGHVEYFSGWKCKWWAYELSLKYFEYFETV